MSASSRSRTLRGRRTVLVTLLVVLSACGVEAGDAGQPVQQDAPDIISSDVEESTTSEPTTTTTAPPPPDLEIVGLVPSDENDAVANAIADLEAFWADAYPEIYGDPYEPLQGGLFAIDSGTDPRSVPCGTRSIEEMLDNAFYCPDEDAVVWDQEYFFPELAEQYGTFTVAVVIAHEWGHVIQERARFSASSVITELQADCFAGAWVGHVNTSDQARFDITIDDLDQSVAGVLSLRDAPGGSADDPYAHGSGFDRVGAFQEGFEDGVVRCAEYADGDPEPYQFPFQPGSIDEAREGNLPLTDPTGDEGIVDLAFPALDAYWADVFPSLSNGDDWDPLVDPIGFEPSDPPQCDGDDVAGQVLFVCIPDRFVAFDGEETIPAVYEQNGDFAVATLFATQYGLDAIDQLGGADSELVAGLQGDCLAGAWSAELVPPATEESYDLVLSPGDLDEAVAVLLTFRSDADRANEGPGFDRVRAFRRGVLQGADACLTISGG